MANKEIHGRYGLGFSRFLFAMAVIMILLLQLMSFFVALNGGYNIRHALVFMLVPMIGPLFCCFQLMLAGTGAPMILVALFVPCSLSILGWARICDDCKNAFNSGIDFNGSQYNKNVPLKILSEQTLPKNSSSQTIKPMPKPQPLPVDSPPPKPQPLPINSPPPKPQPLPIKPENLRQKNDKTEIQTVKQTTVIPTKDETKARDQRIIDPPKTGVPEYDNALRDVLSILNKH
jgi:hypothetical protein